MDVERVKDLAERERERERGEKGVDIRINRAKLRAIQSITPKSMFQQCYQRHPLGAETLSTTTLRIRTLCIVTLRIRALSIMALRM
jgi:hypothetical protein